MMAGGAEPMLTMTIAAQKRLSMVLALPEADRAELASALIASLDGARRGCGARGETGDDWVDVRARILAELGEP